ncbi:MAG: hypothetical protein EXS35_07725 [Pedosphaera sp.]|nr:hypothetical protein [Pedosphaera sp.]
MKYGLYLLLAGLLLTGCATRTTIQSRKQERATAYAALSPEFQKLVDDGQIRRGLSEDAVYIAWGKPAQILHQEDARGAVTTWLYEGGWMEETRYWTGRRSARLEHDYQPRTYVRAEIVFVKGAVESWRSLPQPVY